MTGFAIKGWCPSALRPMLSGDGFLVRVRPRAGRLAANQVAGIADLAARYGNGLVDVTGRGNLQLRGIRSEAHGQVANALHELGLVDTHVELEAQRNILVAPFWRKGDETRMLALELEQALAAEPLGLPEKFGFAVDCGSERVLAQASADIRIERDAHGGLLVRVDGAAQGRTVESDEAVETAIALAKWFVESAGASGGRGRMASHIATGIELPDALTGSAKPASATPTPQPGVHSEGALVGLVFGQIRQATLRDLSQLAPGLRLTPWRMILLEDVHKMPQHDELVTRANDPRLRMIACTGAPTCPEAHAETRLLAARLAPRLPEDVTVHVSGCAKGCAHSNPCSITLVGTPDGLDLVREGTARDRPALCGLDPVAIIANPRLLLGGY